MATKKTGFDARMREVRVRLGFDTAEDFAAASGVPANTYRAWENKDSSPQIATVKSAITTIRDPAGRPIRDRERLFFWLADGEGETPDWLRRDKDADPYGHDDQPGSSPPSPGGPGSVPAMPLTLIAENREILRRVAARELQNSEGRGDLAIVEVATAFEKWVRALPQETKEELARQCRSILLKSPRSAQTFGGNNRQTLRILRAAAPSRVLRLRARTGKAG